MSNLKDIFIEQNPDHKRIVVARVGYKNAEGLCSYQNGSYFFLSNNAEWDGSSAPNKLGYEYSWFICDNTKDDDDIDLNYFKIIDDSNNSSNKSLSIQFLSEKKFEL